MSIQILCQEDPLEEGMETHSSILAWSILWTEEPGGLLSVGLQRVGYDWGTNTHTILLRLSFLNYRAFLLGLLPYPLLPSQSARWFYQGSIDCEHKKLPWKKKLTLFPCEKFNLNDNSKNRSKHNWNQIWKACSSVVLM